MSATKNLLAGDTTIIVLGASGDLAKKKTFPALFGLYRNGFLSKDTHVVGYARTKMDLSQFRQRISQFIKTPHEEIKRQLVEFLELCTYVSGSYDEDEGYQRLNKIIEEFEKDTSGDKNRVFYMALPPSVFVSVAKGLKKNVYSTKGVNRLIVEKPFGMDLDSSRELGKALAPLWTEEETYRIDHYLGKEMVKNLLIIRFANVFFGSIWNRHSIANIQITFKETIGTEGRGGYFDEFGIIRDVMQNHLLQILSIVAMERPVTLNAEDVRNEKVRVLRCISPVKLDDTLLGQYVKSEDGSKPGYLEDETVPKGSNCPTFAAATLWIKNERWEGVPFILRCGKALNEAKTEIRIQFQDVPGNIFNNTAPYESLILDVLKSDHSNFVRDDELDAAWNIFTPILHKIDQAKIKPQAYAYGSRGPSGVDDFVARFGYKRPAQEYHWPERK
ncbi:9617_t:CDS:2 [Ambispora gerdemannii]|uniref:Glucose-6-phosphate 1-dehydrogenase n=1 Tax=Ambispora gerdemannii TaxID=144530 RepID=A0A9N8V0I7_9GLOM|nr:9617_t:CDS:2 [Ambispora gerdemannii]